MQTPTDPTDLFPSSAIDFDCDGNSYTEDLDDLYGEVQSGAVPSEEVTESPEEAEALLEPICWEDLDDLYGSIGQAIAGTAQSVQQLLTLPVQSLEAQRQHDLVIAVNGLNKDLCHFTDKLVAVHEQHLNHTGEITEQDDYIEYLSVGDQYRIIAEEFMAITAPALLTIGECTGEAIEIHEQKTTQAETPHDHTA